MGSIPGFAQWFKDLALPQAVVWVVNVARTRFCYDCSVALGTSICPRYSCKKREKKKKQHNGQPLDLVIASIGVYLKERITKCGKYLICLNVIILNHRQRGKMENEPPVHFTERYINK